MKNIKIFKERADVLNFTSLIDKIEDKELSIPKDFIDAYSQLRIEALSHIIYHCDFSIKFKDLSGVLREISFAKPKSIHLHELDYGQEELTWYPLLWIGEEDAPEGGIFLSLRTEDFGAIYSFKTDPDRAQNSDKLLIADNFTLLLERIVFTDKVSGQAIDTANQAIFDARIKSQIGSDQHWYLWENRGEAFAFPWEE